MHFIKEHIIFKALAILLGLTLWVPAGVKLAHVFEHHKHEVCIGEDSTHIHKVDLDCEFQKFNTAHQLYVTLYFSTLFQTSTQNREYNLTYKLLNNHTPLSFSLRGPPILV
ncbi:hypothetical protein [Algibacter sp. PT7-4]|uniref:hypothetical protein n=1 Tax=Algibacter ulvanivorans TaxID=3400999 RepID=UPI003AACAFC6